MLKRLTTAVLALAFLMTLVGTAVSGPDGDATFRPLVKQSNEQVSTKAKSLLGYTPLANKLTPAQLGAVKTTVPHGGSGPSAPNAPDTTACYLTNYYDVATCFDFTHTALGGTRTRRSMMFDVTASHTATVTGAYAWLYKCNGAGVTPVNVAIEVWSDVGGLPSTLLNRTLVSIPDGTVGSGAYVYLPLSSSVIVPGSNFHIALGADTTAPATDTIRFGSDDGANTTADPCASATPSERSTLFTAASGIWRRSTLVFVQPFDPNFDIVAEFCEAYSSCYVNTPFTGSVFVWQVPDPAWSTAQVLNGFGQRFVADGPETLKNVRVRHFTDPAIGFPGQTFYSPASTNGVTVEVWSDSAGSIDVSSGPLATSTVPGGIATIYPLTGNLVPGVDRIDVPFNLVVLGPYHVTVKMTSNSTADGQIWLATDNFVSNPHVGGSANFVAPDPNWAKFENSVTWTTDIGGGTPQQGAFFVQLDLCRDEFTVCDNEVLYGPSEATGIFGIGSNLIAQRVTGLAVNRVEKVRFQLWDTTVTTSLALVLRGDTAAPGPVVYSQPLVASALSYYPGWNEVVIPGGYQVAGDFFVGLSDASGSPGNIGYLGNNDAMVNGGGYYYSSGASLWRPMGFAFAGYGNWMFEVEFCAIPFDERTCAPDANWATRGHDFQRTSASGLALGDAYCDLNQGWTYEHPTQPMNVGSAPTIHNGRVYAAFGNEYNILDLATGAVLDVINSADNSAILNNLRCAPTVATILDTAGAPQTYMYIGGGAGNSVLCFDVDVLPATLVWVARPTNAYLGHTAIGGMRYATFVIATQADTAGAPVANREVLYFGDDAGKVFAARANNGSPFTPFDGGGVAYTPFVTGQPVTTSGSTDGVRYFSAGLPVAGNGDVFAINLADGTLAWRLSVAQGLQGATLYPAAGAVETFFMPVAVDLAGGNAYINSQMAASLGSQFPMDGVFYTMNNATGVATLPARTSVRSQLVNIMVDQNALYVPGLSNWGAPPLGGVLLGFNKVTNALLYATQAVNLASFVNGGFYQAEGVLTCETGSADLILIGDGGGYLGVFNADNGNLFYYRRIDYTFSAGGPNGARGSAIGADTAGVTHYVLGAAFGTLFDFKKGADRARLQIITAAATKPVPFGSPADTIIAFEDMYWNAGCTPLTVSLKANTTSNGSTPLAKKHEVTVVRDGVQDMASSIAGRLTDNGFSFKSEGTMLASGELTTEVEMDRNNFTPRVRGSQAALATPAFLNEQGVYTGNVFDPNTGSIVTAPGDTSEIRVHVNGPLINRGPQIFFVTFDVHNDPDYYLDDNSTDPEVVLTLVGGCLVDTTYLNFGAGSANTQIVWNMGRWADGDVNNPHGIDIDGDDASVFQGGYMYGITQKRIAMNFDNWSGGGTEADDWISMQADPNFCDNECKPALSTGISLPAITTNGIAYTPVTGNLVCKTYIDSVQNFDVGGGDWQWAFGGGVTAAAPFDNDSTIGLTVSTRTVGVTDAPAAANVMIGGSSVNALNQGTIEVMEFTNRNATPVNNWKFWTMLDYDIGNDTALLDFNASTAWSASTGTSNVAWGMIKLPFGCGYAPMKNVYAIDANQAQFNNSLTDPIYFDSCYTKYASLPAGTASGHAVVTGAADQESQFTIAENNFGPNGTYEIAVVNFRIAGVGPAKGYTDWEAMANMYNKFAGFGRGDVNNDNVTNLSDIIYLADFINFGGKPGPIPFAHLGDVNIDNSTNIGDVTYLINYYFNYGPCPLGEFEF